MRPRSSFRLSIGLSFFVLAGMGVAAGKAWSHAYPAASVPADGATVSDAREVRIQFTEGVELEFSRIDVKNSAGELMNAGKVRRLAPDTLAVELKPLPPGAYVIHWRVLSVDTHITDGVLRFSIGGGGR